MSNDSRRKRARHARETRGKFGSGGNYDPVVRLPGVEKDDWFSVDTKNQNAIDIVEFRITQDWYPTLRCRGGGTCGDLGLVPGELDYKLEIPVHQNVGPNKKQHLCPHDGFGKPCPICEEKFALLEKNNNKWDRDTMGPLNAGWRDFYNLYNYATNQFEPWQAGFNLFEKLLQDALDRAIGELYPWAWDEGKTVEFLAIEEMFNGKPWGKPQIPTFHGRDPYPETIVDEVWGFDKYVKISTYDEIAADFYGMDSGVEVQEQAPVQEEQPTTRTRPRPKSTEAPVSTRSRSRAQVQEDLPFEPDVPAGKNPCPFGHNWGHDVNNTLDCKNCQDEDFNGCIDENDRLKENPSVPSSAPEATPSRRRKMVATEPAPTSSRRRRT